MPSTQSNVSDPIKHARQRQIDVVGLGIHQPPLLSPEVQTLLAQAAHVFGSPRQLASVGPWLAPHVQQIPLPPLAQLPDQLRQASSAVVLASGDPLFYGIGKFLRQQFATSVTCHTNTSSIQGACAATGLSLQDAHVVSLHGRPLHRLRRYLQPGQQVIVLPDEHSQPRQLAHMCQQAGLGASRLYVCERMGYDDAQTHAFTVADWLADADNATAAQVFDPLHVSVLSLLGQGMSYGNFPGIGDHHFVTDSVAGKGMLTKREVRLAVLSILQTGVNDVGWDIGAGCGGVSVEWALWHPHSDIYAIESHPDRWASLKANIDKFGVLDNVIPIKGQAPVVCHDLPPPQRVFVGGSGGALQSILAYAWQALTPGGRLLASAVTETSKHQLLQFDAQVPVDKCEFMQVSISKQDVLSNLEILRPNLPVTLMAWDKPYD